MGRALGIAYAIGPNYNKGWEAFDAVDLTTSLSRARSELDLAREALVDAARGGSPVDDIGTSLVAALTLRYAALLPEDTDTWQAGHEAYADAMAEVAAAYPQDLDVLALAADALVNVTAWALWDPLTGEPAPGSRAREAERLLDAALALPGGDRHPFVLHLHIHLLEMSERPEAALSSADRLRGLVPDAGHLQHMPSHLDVLCGDYHSSIAANRRAVEADRLFVERSGPLNFYSLYRAHDLHFIVYSAMFLGRYRDASDAADELSAQLTPELLRIESPPMADWLEAFVPLRTHVLVRFGRWDDLVAQPLPEDRELYCTTTAMVLYGRGVAYAALGDVAAARTAREELVEAVARVPDSATSSTTRLATSSRSPGRCSTARSPTGKDDSRRVHATCDGPSLSTTPSPTTSRGAGCSRRATRTEPSCSNRAGSTRRRPCMRPTSGWTRR